jgi:membrane associated rhomboid family serine protease
MQPPRPPIHVYVLFVVILPPQPRRYERVRKLLDALLPRRIPFACLALMALNLVLLLLAELWGSSQSYVTLKRMGAGLSELALGTEPWRLLSAGYLHLGWRHLLLNFTALVLCGFYLEGLIGPWRLLLLHTFSILVTNVLLMHFFPDLLVMGASGGIYGLLGALLVLCFRSRSIEWWQLRHRIAPAVFCLALLASSAHAAYVCGQPGANAAHLSAVCLGALLALVGALTWELLPPSFLELSRVYKLACVVMGVTLGCLGLALGSGRAWELREPQPLVRVKVPGTPISVAVPSGAAAHTSLEHSEGDDTWVRLMLGESLTEPVVVEVLAEKLEEAVPEEQLEESTRELLEEFNEEMQQSKDEDDTQWRWLWITRLYTKPVVYSASNGNNGYWMQRWVMYRGEWRITMWTVRAPGMPTNWEGMEADIALSLVVEEPGAPRWDTCRAWNTAWSGVCPREP